MHINISCNTNPSLMRNMIWSTYCGWDTINNAISICYTFLLIYSIKNWWFCTGRTKKKLLEKNFALLHQTWPTGHVYCTVDYETLAFLGKFSNSGLTLAGAVNYDVAKKIWLDIVQLITNQEENLRFFGENFAMLDFVVLYR